MKAVWNHSWHSLPSAECTTTFTSPATAGGGSHRSSLTLDAVDLRRRMNELARASAFPALPGAASPAAASVLRWS